MALDGSLLVVGKRLPSKPCPANTTEQIGVRTAGDQVRVQDRMHLVLDPRPVPHDLVPPCNQTAKALGGRIRRPDLRQVAGRMQARQHTGIDLVGLHVRMGDCLHLRLAGLLASVPSGSGSIGFCRWMDWR
jgi:hypothetical protein